MNERICRIHDNQLSKLEGWATNAQLRIVKLEEQAMTKMTDKDKFILWEHLTDELGEDFACAHQMYGYMQSVIKGHEGKK